MPKQQKEQSSDSDESAEAKASSHDNDRPNKKAKTSLIASTPLDVVSDITKRSSKKHHPLIVILDQATLETVKSKNGIFELLNCDDHRDICKKKLKKDPNEFRPDILHQELLALLDSPLNKAGLLKVYISTKTKVLIDVNASIRIPRTYKRFAGLMVQLLHKLKIKASTESTALLQVIKNPVQQYLPAGTRVYGFSSGGTLYRPSALVQRFVPMHYEGGSVPTAFVIGAMSTGHVTIHDYPYIEEMLSISSYPLSGAAAITRLLGAIEEQWGVI